MNALIQRGMRVVKVSGRLRPILCVERSLGHTVFAHASLDDCKAESQAIGKVVLLFASYPSRVGDGPMRRRPRLGGLLKDDYREAA